MSEMATSSPIIVDGMSSSPFAKLPTELRNNIWELVFSGLWDITHINLLQDLHRNRPAEYQADTLISLSCSPASRSASKQEISPGKTNKPRLGEQFANEPHRIRAEYGRRHHRITTLEVGDPYDGLIGQLLALARGGTSAVKPCVERADRVVEAVLRSLTGLRELTVHDTSTDRYHFESKKDSVVLEYLAPFLQWTPRATQLVIIGRTGMRRMPVEHQ
nr:hypothetical protein B0A51_18032 [Rachicladosporium sp. CCFEE 5018]